MTATTLADVRGSLADTLTAAWTGATVYRTRQTNYQFPAFVVGWPETMDVRPTLGDPRDFVISVYVAVAMIENDSSDELLSELLEAAVTALQDGDGRWDVQPVTDFEEVPTADSRTVLWCRLPVAVYS